MPDPRLPRGAILRFAIVLGVAAFLLFPCLTRADEAADGCGPLEATQALIARLGGLTLAPASEAQAEFLRAALIAEPAPTPRRFMAARRCSRRSPTAGWRRSPSSTAAPAAWRCSGQVAQRSWRRSAGAERPCRQRAVKGLERPLAAFALAALLCSGDAAFANGRAGRPWIVVLMARTSVGDVGGMAVGRRPRRRGGALRRRGQVHPAPRRLVRRRGQRLATRDRTFAAGEPDGFERAELRPARFWRARRARRHAHAPWLCGARRHRRARAAGWGRSRSYRAIGAAASRADHPTRDGYGVRGGAVNGEGQRHPA